jgi:Mce-associated membrane protein
MPIPHHVLQRRRRGTADAAPGRAPETEERPEPAEEPEPVAEEPAAGPAARAKEARAKVKAKSEPEADSEAEPEVKSAAPGRLVRLRGLLGRPVTLGVVTVLLGGLAAWSAVQAHDLRSGSVADNVALTDTGRTSEAKGQLDDAVNELFSYSYTDMTKTEQAAKRLLTGKAVQQYDNMLAPIRQEAVKQKLVLTTTVTDSGVKLLDGDRARVLIYADQRSTRTGKEETTHSAAMLALDAVRQGDTWKITNIDTLNVPR